MPFLSSSLGVEPNHFLADLGSDDILALIEGHSHFGLPPLEWTITTDQFKSSGNWFTFSNYGFIFQSKTEKELFDAETRQDLHFG
jgi:hypothetical protein